MAYDWVAATLMDLQWADLKETTRSTGLKKVLQWALLIQKAQEKESCSDYYSMMAFLKASMKETPMVLE